MIRGFITSLARATRRPPPPTTIRCCGRCGLIALPRTPTAPAGVARRSRAIVLLENGHSGVSTAERVGLSPRPVQKWGQRFLQRGVQGLDDQPAAGPKAEGLARRRPHTWSRWRCERPDLRDESVATGLCGDGTSVGSRGSGGQHLSPKCVAPPDESPPPADGDEESILPCRPDLAGSVLHFRGQRLISLTWAGRPR